MRRDGRALLALPGVPAELAELLAGEAGALLDDWLPGTERLERRVRLISVPESHASARSAPLPELESLDGHDGVAILDTNQKHHSGASKLPTPDDIRFGAIERWAFRSLRMGRHLHTDGS